ncbi:MAG TPA: DUF4386 domain-containing protein [Gammaproteobacteria bacterium]
MPNHAAGFSPKTYARTAGFLYLIVIVAGVFAEMVARNPLVVAHDAATTAQNILAHQTLFRMGFSAELVACLCNIPLALIFYELFKIVNKRVTLLTVFFSLVGTAIESMDLLNHFSPLIFLQGIQNLRIDPDVMQAQAYLALTQQSIGFAIALTYFGGFCLSLGYLIYKSDFMPRVIGVLLAIEGVCYLANSFTLFLVPQHASFVFSLLIVSALAELILCLWLLVMGVNVERWEEKAGMKASSKLVS